MKAVAETVADVRQAIEQKNRLFEASFREGDPARGAREVYTRKGRAMPPGADTVQGREKVANFWHSAAAGMGIVGIQLETLDLTVSGKMACEVGRGTLRLQGGQEVAAKYVVVWKKEDGEWRWDVDIWNT